MATVPESYLDAMRPPLEEAIRLEGLGPREAIESLTRKGFFSPPPRPWCVGERDRGHGHMSYAVLDKFGSVIFGNVPLETAEFVVDAANAYDPNKPPQA